MMSSLMWLLWFEYKVFHFFFKKLYKFHSVEVLSKDHVKQEEFQVTYIYFKPIGEICAMCAQHDLELMPKRSQKKDKYLSYMNYEVKKCTIKNTLKERNIWCLNFITLWIHGRKGYNFLRLLYKMVVWRSYGYFLKCSYLDFFSEKMILVTITKNLKITRNFWG